MDPFIQELRSQSRDERSGTGDLQERRRYKNIVLGSAKNNGLGHVQRFGDEVAASVCKSRRRNFRPGV